MGGWVLFRFVQRSMSETVQNKNKTKQIRFKPGWKSFSDLGLETTVKRPETNNKTTQMARNTSKHRQTTKDETKQKLLSKIFFRARVGQFWRSARTIAETSKTKTKQFRFRARGVGGCNPLRPSPYTKQKEMLTYVCLGNTQDAS